MIRKLSQIIVLLATSLFFLGFASSKAKADLFTSSLAVADPAVPVQYDPATDTYTYTYVPFTNNASSILRYNQTTGALIGTFVQGTASDLFSGSTFGTDGNLYVADQANSDVLRFNGQTGAFLGDFVTPNSGGLQNPEDVVFGPDGDLYVSSITGGGVLRYNGITGQFLGVVASTNSVGKKLAAAGLTFGPDGNLYISSIISDNSILRYDLQNNQTNVFIAPSIAQPSPGQVAFSPDGKYLLDGTFGPSISIKKYNAQTGALLGDFVPASNNGGLLSTSRLRYGPDGNLYASDFVGNAIREFNGTTGAPLGNFIAPGGMLNNPAGFNFYTPVPEASTWLGALSFGAAYFGARLVLKGQQKRKD